jgi:hypothetical protein
LVSHIERRTWTWGKIYENRVFRGIFRPKKEEVAGDWISCIMKSFKLLTPR